jgi:hypothetical protein
MLSEHEAEDLMTVLFKALTQAKAVTPKSWQQYINFNKTTTTCAMISFSQFFHGNIME